MSLSIHLAAQADAPYMVLSSGLGGHASFWNPQIRVLQQHFHVVTYDQEGCHSDSALLPVLFDRPYGRPDSGFIDQ